MLRGFAHIIRSLRCAQERNLGVCWDFSSVYSRVCVIGQRGFIIFCFSMFVFSLEKIFFVWQSLTRPLSTQDTRSLLRLRLETFFSYVRSFLRMFLTQSRAIDTNWLLITAHICSRDVPTDLFFRIRKTHHFLFGILSFFASCLI